MALAERVLHASGGWSTYSCVQRSSRRVGGTDDVRADAVMGRIVDNSVWIESDSTKMREHAAVAS